MKKALFSIFSSLPILIIAFSISMWYLGTITVLPALIIAAVIWFFGIFRPYERLSRTAKAAILTVLWIASVAAAISPYIVFWLALNGEHHL